LSHYKFISYLYFRSLCYYSLIRNAKLLSRFYVPLDVALDIINIKKPRAINGKTNQ